MLVVPVTIIYFVVSVELRYSDPCYYEDIFPSHLFFNAPDIYDADDFFASKVRVFKFSTGILKWR